MTVFKLLWLALLAMSLQTADALSQQGEQSGSIREGTGALQRQFREAAGDLRCPTCFGLSILESDAPFSQQIKNMVEEKVLEGYSKAEILEFFVDRYGPWILREPPREGFSLIAWIFPLAILTLGPIAVWFFVWRRRRNVETFGVRAAEEILQEFEQHVARLQAKG